jgi:hypothetical protein
VARRLVHLDDRANGALDRAGDASGARQLRQYRKARKALERIVTVATTADGKGTLGVSLSAVQQAVTALLALVPPA